MALLVMISISSVAFAATTTTRNGTTTGGTYGSTTVFAECNGDDNGWGWDDDVYATTDTPKTIHVRSYAKINWSGGYNSDYTAAYDGDTTCHVYAANNVATTANSHHTVTSADWGNFSCDLSSVYNK